MDDNLNWHEYEKAKKTIKEFEKRREEIRKERSLRKNGSYFDFYEFQTIKLNQQKELYSNELFTVSRSKENYNWLGSYFDDMLKDIFEKTKLIREFRKEYPDNIKQNKFKQVSESWEKQQ